MRTRQTDEVKKPENTKDNNTTLLSLSVEIATLKGRLDTLEKFIMKGDKTNA